MTGVTQEMKSKPALFPVNSTTFQPYNQLKFTLQNSKTSHESFRPVEVGPIIIEKLSLNSSIGKNLLKSDSIFGFKPKIISQERLDIACKLARQDFQNKMLLENLSVYSETDLKNQVLPSKDNHKETHQDSSSSHEMCIKDLSKSSEIKLKESQKKTNLVLSKKQKQPKNYVSWNDLKTSYSARNDSVRTYNLNNPQIEEIKRLRKSLVEYVDKIDNLVRQAILQNEFKQLENEDDAESKQKTARAVEQVTRSARIIYALEQQVKKIHHQIIQSGSGKTRQTKKATALLRLISVHKAAFQILQYFVNNLPALGIHQSLPHVYHKLANFLYQLTLCCIQLDIERDSGFPNLKLYPLLMKQQRMNKRKKPKPNWDSSSTTVSVLPKASTSKEYSSAKEIIKENIDLKHLIEQLMQKKKQISKKGLKPVNLKLPGKTKGVLIPSRFKYGRPKTSAFCKPYHSSSNYTLPTHSSRLKSISSKESNVACKRENSFTRFTDCSPECITPTKLKDSGKIGDSKPIIEKEIISMTNETSNGHINDNIQDTSSPSQIRISSSVVKFMEPVIAEQRSPSTPTSETSWSDMINKKDKAAFRKTLQPLIDKTDQLISKQVLLTEYFEMFKSKLEKKSTPETSFSQETSPKSQSNKIKLGNILSQFVFKSPCPSLNAMIQRIQEMEDTENEIRRRLGSINYNDSRGVSQYKSNGIMNAIPKSPSPMIFTKDSQQTGVKERRQQTDLQLDFSRKESPEILYIKPKSSEKNFIKSDPNIPVKKSLDLSNQQKKNIITYKKKYDQHLKRTSHFSSASFNPWEFVKEVADEILDDVIEEVAKELSDVCSDVVEQIYKAEFNLPSESNPGEETL